MVMMSKLTAKDKGANKQVKPKIFQSKGRGQTRKFYDRCNCDQRNYQNRCRSDNRDRRISFSSRIQYGQNYRGKPKYEQNYGNDFRRNMSSPRGNYRGNARTYQNQNFGRQKNRGVYRVNYRNENYERGRSRYTERQYSGNIRRNNISSSTRSRSGSRVSTNRDRIRCYKCREYDHFTKDCLSSKVAKKTDQIQQYF